MTTKQLARPQAVTDPGRPSTIGTKDGDERANHFVLWGFIITLIGAAIGIVGKRLLHEDIVTVVGVLISLAGLCLVVYPYLAPSRRKQDESSFSSQPEVLTPPQRTEYLLEGSSIEYIPSVTERTTNLLKNSATKKPAQKEDKILET
ncbi:MAG TPA: hypothetical protein VFX63_01845 [Pyrinomonadaceae bacterium]|nr:hypothetical protein [Pyrinomonadaceae bacterium]